MDLPSPQTAFYPHLEEECAQDHFASPTFKQSKIVCLSVLWPAKAEAKANP